MGIESWDQIFTPERLVAIGQGVLRLLLVLGLTRICLYLSSFGVDRLLRQYKRLPRPDGGEARANTIAALLKSVTRYVIYFVGIVWALDTVGVRAGSVMAAAGIGGLAVGFGAQNLVRDVISGFFILFEDQYGVGEYVTVDSASGFVEEVGLRSTRIRAFQGDLHFIPNGSIKVVTNHSRGAMRVWLEVQIAYEADHRRAMEVAARACEELRSRLDYVVEGPKVMGLEGLGAAGATISIWALARNMKQWSLEREIRQAVKEAFEREGIPAPYPRTVVVQDDQTRHGSGRKPESPA
jgi:small conductance mechanosensitive channel